MTTTRRTALLSGLAAITGAFVPRLFRRGLPAVTVGTLDASAFTSVQVSDSVTAYAVFDGVGNLVASDGDLDDLVARFGLVRRAAEPSREGQLVALRPDGTVEPAT